MPAKPFSGKSGTAYKGTQKICDLAKWTFEPSVDVTPVASNCSEGFKQKVVGNGDSKGTIKVWITPNSKMLLKPGDEVTLKLRLDRDSETDRIEVPAVITSAPIEVDIEGATPVSATVNFEGDGAWTGYGVFATGSPTCCTEIGEGEEASSSGE